MNSKEQWMGSYKKDPSSLFFEALFPRLREVLSFSILVLFSVSFKLIWGASLSQSSGRMEIFQSSVRIKDLCSLDSSPWKGRTGTKGKDSILKKKGVRWNEMKRKTRQRKGLSVGMRLCCRGWQVRPIPKISIRTFNVAVEPAAFTRRNVCVLIDPVHFLIPFEVCSKRKQLFLLCARKPSNLAEMIYLFIVTSDGSSALNATFSCSASRLTHKE